jgi:hypothetical protein
MKRPALLFGVIALSLLIAVAALQTPRPATLDAPGHQFSAGRAMEDVRRIARAPHPVGAVEHARVADHLLARMTALGLAPAAQPVNLSPAAVRRLQDWGAPPDAAGSARNLVGVLPGRSPDLPALLLMAHYDSVPDSPGAADDASGVAAILETVRAVRARGPADRTLIVLFTDAEELNLDGARTFFSEHPLRDRVGAVINLEARGGGGRAMMFETGPGNAETVALLGPVARSVSGGVTSNSLAVFVYEHMPNGTDFTIPRSRGVPGLNFAFLGRAAQYHTPAATAEALDQGSLQHIGGQTLALADTLMRAAALPVQSEDRVYADVFGRFILSHSPGAGWALLALTAAMAAVAALGAWRAGSLSFRDFGLGAVRGLWFLGAGLTVAALVRALAGPVGSRVHSAEVYYGMLRRLPWLEAGLAAGLCGVALLALAGRGAGRDRIGAAGLLLAAVVAVVLGAPPLATLAPALIAAALCFAPKPSGAAPRSVELGLLTLVFVAAVPLQLFAPTAAHLFLWPALLAAAALAVSALWSARRTRPWAVIPLALAATAGPAWLLTLAHPVFLGVGMDLPGALVVIGLLALLLLQPLVPDTGGRRPLVVAGVVLLLLGCGVAAAARPGAPIAPSATLT